MISTEIPVSLSLPDPKTERSKGIHVSSIIRCIATETGILKPEWAEELSLVDVRQITDPTAILRISIGLAWEEWFIDNILGPQGVVNHPGEMEVDGVFLTHDGESLDVIITRGVKRAVIVVHEVKATFKSTTTVGDVTGQSMYLMQIKAYCHALNTRFAKIHVLFLCGDYKYPIKPQIKTWELEFTEQEIKDNWDLLMDYKEHRLRIESNGGD